MTINAPLYLQASAGVKKQEMLEEPHSVEDELRIRRAFYDMVIQFQSESQSRMLLF